EGNFRREEAMLLRHGGFGSIENIVNQRRAVAGSGVGTIDIGSLLLVNQEQVVATIAPLKINRFSQLHISIRPQNGQSDITPGGKPIRSKPIHAEVARPSITP